MSRSRQKPSLDALNAESSNLRSQIASQVNKADDPLELYDSFVKWIFDNYPSEHLASSGLIELLEEATRRYKNDSSYKGDLRYLKLWTLYASLVDKPSAVFKFILTNGIGIVYALLFEEYALALERDSRHSAADEVYRAGIQRKARPSERLKKKYDEFRRRTSSKPPVPPPAARVALPKVKGTAEADLLRRQPLKNYDSTKAPAHAPPKSASASSSQASSLPSSSTSQPHNRYAHMLAPPVAGKRPEKLRLDLRLLFTEENGEFSMPEARARSMGLLGKKWGPPPASELTRENASTAQVNFNDDGTKNTRSNLSRRNLAGAEPTVTINTKAALADVFGMYNSPEKSTRFSAMPGGKHAPVRAIEAVTPLSLLPQSRPVSEKPNNPTAPPSFTPFVDENAARKENAAPPKFKPFVDADSQARPTAPAPAARRALASKDIGTAASAPAPKGAGATSNVFSKVFTPVAKEEVKQPSEHPPKPEGQTARTNGASKPSSTKFPFLGDAQAPFKVFSRPPEKASVFSKPGGVTPFLDGVSSTASALSKRTPLGTFVPQRTGSEKAQAHSEDEDDQDEDIPSNTAVDYDEDTDEYESSHNAPFGGRFGQFNVMTPITERTLEYTSTGRFSIPDSDVSTLGEKTIFGEPDAVVAAERLAAEVRRDNVFVSEHGHITSNDDATSASSFVPPFRLSDGYTTLGHDEVEKDSRLQANTALVEEKTGTLDLSDNVFGAPAFKPTNPCNPFDPSITSTLLSQLPPNPEHYHSSHSSQLLDDLQKFARKQVKTNGTFSASRTFSLELGDKRFCVYEKLGEGGFGAVFAAKVVTPKSGGDDDDDDDDDDEDEDEESHRVAIKVVKPHNIWEFRMLHRAHECLPTRLRSSLIHPQALHTFHDESFLVLDLCTQGSLLDIINHAVPAGISQHGACLDELLVMFFTIELLRLLEGLHGAGIIHGDLKIDNCLVRLEDVPGGASLWAAQYDPAGAHGWNCKGIKLIDFGRAIDTRLFPRGQAFLADWPTDARDCVEMREGSPWTYQADYFGLAGIVYCMLYGKYIETSSVVRAAPAEAGEDTPRYKLATGFKRYWQTDLWTRLFDVLLNPCLVRHDGALPLPETLALLRLEMEEWLQANCNRSSNTLKGLLKKVELFVIRSH